jgi:hypothetical protein
VGRGQELRLGAPWPGSVTGLPGRGRYAQQGRRERSIKVCDVRE